MSKNNRIVPRTPEEAKRWAKYTGWAWDWYHIGKWPDAIRTAAMKKHKNRSDRFKMFVFFVGNGMNPNIAIERIIADDPVDKAGMDDLLQMFDRIKKNREKITYWDIALNHTETIYIPDNGLKVNIDKPKLVEIPKQRSTLISDFEAAQTNKYWMDQIYGNIEAEEFNSDFDEWSD